MAEIRILSTKNLPSNQKQFLLNAHFLLVEADFVVTSYLPEVSISSLNEILLFTSQNAVHAILQHSKIALLKTKKVFCVGLKTKALLEANGFTVEAFTNYAEDLAEIISLVYSDCSFTFFCGNLRRDTLPQKLQENGIVLEEIKVYATHINPHKINAKLDGILFFSPSGVESFLKENNLKNAMCFCIGNTTAEALKPHTNNIIIATQPSVENVIIQCIQYYKQNTDRKNSLSSLNT